MNCKKALGWEASLVSETLRSTEQSKEVHFFYTLNYTHLPRKLKYLKSRLAEDDITTGHPDLRGYQPARFHAD